MSGIERDDWDGTEPPAQVEKTNDGQIARPDWNGAEPPMDVSKSETHPDWPLADNDEPETLEAAEQTAPEQTADNVVDNMIAGLAEEQDLEIAHEAIEATLDAVPLSDRAGFEAGFDGLPPGAQKAIVTELAQPGGEWQGMADEDELANFASTPEGAELVALWDDDADVNLARVQARLSRIEMNTSPAAIDEMWEWYDSLPSAQAKAVLNELAR